MIVTKSYDDLFHRLLWICQMKAELAGGAVVIGQPGVGVFPQPEFLLCPSVN